MQKHRIWLIGSVLVTAAVVMLGGVLGIQPQLAAAAAADLQRASVETANAGHAAVLAQLKEDFENIEVLSQELSALTTSVPLGTEVPAFVSQLDTLAGSSGVTLTVLTVADAQPYTPVTAAVAGTAEETGEAALVGSVAPGAAAPVAGQLITADNFAALPVEITVTGDYGNVLDFINGLQTGSRLFLVDGVTTAEWLGDTGIVDATISGLIYVIATPSAATVSSPATTG